MHSESGSKYPVGPPKFWKGDYIPDEARGDNKYYFVRIKTRFYIKKDMLPFIQIKNSLMYLGNECLETSDIKGSDGKYYQFYRDKDGNLQSSARILTLTETDYKLLKEHYTLRDFEILDGCYFTAQIGIFDDYINKYRDIKIHATGARRQLAKLFLNNLYGKMAASTESSFKIAYMTDKESISFLRAQANDKKPGYIPVGSAITSYARNFTIRTAQKNYHGADNPGFIYADTDSIHCDLSPEELLDVPVHPTAFCHWKIESSWDKGIFVRQKTYIEHVIAEDLVPKDKPFYSIRCAGMPEKCKELFNLSLTTREPIEGKKYSDEELKFIEQPRTLSDFKVGLIVPGKLLPKRIKGGVLLTTTTYEMR